MARRLSGYGAVGLTLDRLQVQIRAVIIIIIIIIIIFFSESPQKPIERAAIKQQKENWKKLKNTTK